MDRLGLGNVSFRAMNLESLSSFLCPESGVRLDLGSGMLRGNQDD